MTPFRIQCETCQTRLRVREEGFIGEVHACPRCGSMVLIVPPTVSTTEATAPSIEALAPSLTLGLSETLIPDEVLDEVAASQPAAQPDVAEPPIAEPPVAEPTIVEPAVTKPTETPATTVPSQAAWLRAVAPALTAVTLTAASGLLWFVYGGTKEPTPPVVVVAEPKTDTPSLEAAPLATTVLKPTIEDSVEMEPPAETILVETTPIEKSIEAPEPTPSIEEPIRVAATTPAEPEAMHLPEEFDPLDFDPETIDLVLRRGGVEPTPTVEKVESDENPPIDRTPTVTERIDARLAEAARTGGVSVRRAPSSEATNHAPTTPADRLLAQTLPGIDLKNVPLSNAVQLLSELTGAPLSLRPQDLQLAGVDARREISIKGTGLTLGELITESFRPVRLVPQIEGAHVLLHRKDADIQRTVKHRLADLAGDDPVALESLLEQIGPATLAIPIQINGGTLSLSAPRRTHYELLLLCERLRVARRLEQQSPYPHRLIATTPALADLASLLERRTTFSFVQPTPMRDVISHWQRVTGLTILVDWRSLADADLGPLSAIECSVTNRPWSEALDGVLGPLGLAWAAADGETLWIASREATAATQIVEFYPTRATVGAALVERIADEHPMAGVVYNEASGAVIVRGNTHVQRAVHATWREL